MAEKKPVGNPDIYKYGKRFSSTYQPKKKGRPPQNLRKFVKGVDVSREDMQDFFAMMAVKFKTIEEVKQAVGDPEAHPIVRIYGKAILSEFARNKVDTIERIINRAWGLPGEHTTNKNVNINTTAEQAASMSPEERQEYMNKIKDELRKEILNEQEDDSG